MLPYSQALVFGLGASGMAAARLLRAEDTAVQVVDERDTPETRARADELAALGCGVELGVSQVPPGDVDVAVVSPGWAMDGPMLSALRARGVPLVAEMELGWSRFRGRTVAVTGSNGKSSVVKALASAFGVAGLAAIPCGNYGRPVCQAVLDSPAADWLVIEVSSFQLETCRAFRPEVGLLLNLYPNHLDRHGTLAAYARLKARLFSRQQPGDVALVPPEWLESFRAWSGGQGTWTTFGTEPEAALVYSPGRITGGGQALDIQGSLFDNPVLGPNAAGVYGAARGAGLASDPIQHALMQFEPLPHRAQPIGEWDGIAYVDDSKATNLAAMIASLQMQDRPVWLIAGGRPKETDFAAALPVLRERVRGVFLIGEAAVAMAAAWGQAVPCQVCGTLEQAVAAARAAARAGECILLAPACTSYDQFRSYLQRGEAFGRYAAAAHVAAEKISGKNLMEKD